MKKVIATLIAGSLLVAGCAGEPSNAPAEVGIPSVVIGSISDNDSISVFFVDTPRGEAMCIWGWNQGERSVGDGGAGLWCDLQKGFE